FSQVTAIDRNRIYAIDWGCQLQLPQGYPHALTQIAIRAHHLELTTKPGPINSFPCELVTLSFTQHRVTLHLTLTPHGRSLQMEMLKTQWEQFQHQPAPWYLSFNISRLILLTA
ncbi:MAG: molybdate ABC transporter permease subunit, partial [Synechococcaceae cyanobacterium RL_1_2]|nr:molybdate ABC transporter permease subunit [Synechococcaceae cyanobacterium RL_1_2]